MGKKGCRGIAIATLIPKKWKQDQGISQHYNFSLCQNCRHIIDCKMVVNAHCFPCFCGAGLTMQLGSKGQI